MNEYAKRTIESLRSAHAEFMTGTRGWILASVSAGWFLSFGVRLVFPALLPTLRESFGMSFTLAGVLISTLWLTYAVCQFPAGLVRDWIGDRRTLTLSTGITAVTVGVVALSVDVAMLFLGVILFASSTALFGPTRYTVLSDTFPDNDGTAIGISLAAGNIGNAVLPATAGAVAAVASWRWGFAVTVPLFALTAVLLWRSVPEPEHPTEDSLDELSVDVFREAVRHEVLVLTGILILVGFAWQGFAGFYVSYLVTIKELSPGLAATLFSGFFLVGVGVQVVAGWAVDRFGARPSLLAFLSVMVLVFASLPFLSTTPAFVGISVLASSILGIRPIANTRLVRALPPTVRGTSFGLLRTAFIMLASAGPVTVGALADRNYFDEAMFLLGGVILLALVLAALVPPAGES